MLYIPSAATAFIFLVIGLLACGPLAQPEPGSLTNVAPEAQESEPEPEDTPTPGPTVCVTLEEKDGSIRDICITPSPPSTSSKYQMGMQDELREAEQSTGRGGESGEAAELHVRVNFGVHRPGCEVNTTEETYIACIRGYSDPVIAYLRENNVELPPDPEEKAFFEIWATPSVIRAIAQMDPVSSVEPVGKAWPTQLAPICVFDDQGKCQ